MVQSVQVIARWIALFRCPLLSLLLGINGKKHASDPRSTVTDR